MATSNKAGRKTPAVPKVVISRVIQAPCALVYQMWTEPAHLAQWFGPEDCKCRSVSADIKVGGAFRIHVTSKKGDHIAIGKYQKVVRNSRLQFTWSFVHYAMPDSVVNVDFEDLGKTTRLTLTHQGLPDREDAREHKRGWTSVLRKFAGLMKQGKLKPARSVKKSTIQHH
jgi:uncharacterized protein YndB with AHSA1/START domain